LYAQIHIHIVLSDLTKALCQGFARLEIKRTCRDRARLHTGFNGRVKNRKDSKKAFAAGKKAKTAGKQQWGLFG
jgi:hypothetical protein